MALIATIKHISIVSKTTNVTPKLSPYPQPGSNVFNRKLLTSVGSLARYREQCMVLTVQNLQLNLLLTRSVISSKSRQFSEPQLVICDMEIITMIIFALAFPGCCASKMRECRGVYILAYLSPSSCSESLTFYYMPWPLV